MRQGVLVAIGGLAPDLAQAAAEVDRWTEVTYHSSLRTHMENVSYLTA
jgi:hypothetical protein